jgi:hypothetical protein
MRTTLIATLVAMGIGLIGTSSTFAAPANGSAIRGALELGSMTTQASYHYRRRYRPYCYYVTRCSGYYPYQVCWKERVCR